MFFLFLVLAEFHDLKLCQQISEKRTCACKGICYCLERSRFEIVNSDLLDLFLRIIQNMKSMVVIIQRGNQKS